MGRFQFESSNANTRNLKCLQANMLQLDMGLWSGFKRKTELAESFLGPLLTVSDNPQMLGNAKRNPSSMAVWRQTRWIL
jgi:hypothetical protein